MRIYINSLLLIFLFTTPIYNQSLHENILVPFDPQNNDSFGGQVAVSDSFLFISSLRYSNPNENSVYVYEYENNDYIFRQKIFPSDSQAGPGGALFGSELFYNSGKLFVGARNKRLNGFTLGAVYIFEFENDNWIEKQKIIPPLPHFQSLYFSSSIWSLNEYLLVGAERYMENNIRSGKVFLYKYNGKEYNLYQEFIPFDPQEFQLFGNEVYVDSGMIIITSIVDSTTSGPESGSFYVYEKTDTTWEFSRKYIPPPFSDFLSLGTSIAVTNKFVFMGTSGSINYNQPGKVYIYSREGTDLKLIEIIETEDGYWNDRFGLSLSAKGDSLLVGALFDTVKTSASGAAYLFVNKGKGWKKQYKIYPSNEEAANGYSVSTKIKDGIIYIGAHETIIDSIRSGVLYIYTPTPANVVNLLDKQPDKFFLAQNYPNPFNSKTKIEILLQESGILVIELFDTIGRRVKTLVNEKKAKGNHTIEMDLTNMASGVYLYKAEFLYNTENKIKHSIKTKKAVYIK